nr:oxygenase MpaB family protein [Demequina pelophila]
MPGVNRVIGLARRPVERARARLGNAVFSRVAGPDGTAAHRRVHGTPGPRRFAPGTPIRRVHADSSMYVGGIRALLLQSLHPLAMAGVAGHSGYRGDPWGRLARTATFLAFTTFGTVDDADATIARIRAIHERVRGRAPDGRAYRASDPHLLTWVHVAEADSFLAAHQRFGHRPLDAAEADEYVAQTALIGRALGAVDVPESVEELAATLDRYRDELAATDAARDAAAFLLREPPLPWAARAPYALLAAGAVELLPPYARRMLELHRPLAGGVAGTLGTAGIRWAMGSFRRAAETDPAPTPDQDPVPDPGRSPDPTRASSPN